MLQPPIPRNTKTQLDERFMSSNTITPCSKDTDGNQIIQISLKAVGNLAEKRFFIPNYQRGYRWDADQVTALLDDLAEFEENFNETNDLGGFYCLQPLVVVKRKDKMDREEWEVVDGQQRLTTIFLILKQLSPKIGPLFHIRYERHGESPDGLDGLLKDSERNNEIVRSPDFHFLNEAQKVIGYWFQENENCKLSSLTSIEGACAKFIWHEIEGKNEAIHAFTRLNAGKIKLKDSELIRALLLQKGNLDQDRRQQFALRWDQIEQRLQDSEFWSFLSPKGFDTDNRIELIFRIIAEQKKWIEPNDRAIFGHICELLTDNKEREKLWQDVEDLFSTLNEWFEDNHLFHLIGFLVVEKGERVSSLLKEASNLRKKDFFLHLKKKIREMVLNGITSPNKLDDFLRDVEYDNKNHLIKALLLCHNLATLEAAGTDNVRFSFNAYRNDEWDIEHIRATASRLPKNADEFIEALTMIREYLDKLLISTSEENIQKKLEEDLTQIDLALEKQTDNPEKLMQLYGRLRDEMEGSKELNASNGLENLTLLDAKTNRGYGNSPFAVKRKWVLGLDRQAKYLLPCTRNVFTKSYSKAPINLLCWTPEDAEDYITSIKERLNIFFKPTWDFKV